MNQALTHTDLSLPGIQSVFYGKVRDVYFLEGDLIAMVATDRISAFDAVSYTHLDVYKRQSATRVK